jgi:hypothetical protein
MKKRSRKTAVVIESIALIAALIMLVSAVVVFAQDDAPAEPALPFGRGGFHGGHHGGFDGRSYGSAGDEALAESLGITVQELQAAREE